MTARTILTEAATDLAADSPLTLAELRELNTRRELAPALAAMSSRERIGAAAVLAEANGRGLGEVLALFHRLVEGAGLARAAEPAFAPIAVAEILDAVVDAVETARAAAGSTAWRNAIEDAYGYLLQADVIRYDADAHALQVESATRPGRVYVANGACQCEAFTKGATGVCWHRAAARLVRRALELQDLAGELLAEAQERGEADYDAELARAGARLRLPALTGTAEEWDAAAEAAQRAALFARTGAAPARRLLVAAA